MLVTQGRGYQSQLGISQFRKVAICLTEYRSVQKLFRAEKISSLRESALSSFGSLQIVALSHGDQSRRSAAIKKTNSILR